MVRDFLHDLLLLLSFRWRLDEKGVLGVNTLLLKVPLDPGPRLRFASGANDRLLRHRCPWWSSVDLWYLLRCDLAVPESQVPDETGGGSLTLPRWLENKARNCKSMDRGHRFKTCVRVIGWKFDSDWHVTDLETDLDAAQRRKTTSQAWDLKHQTLLTSLLWDCGVKSIATKGFTQENELIELIHRDTSFFVFVLVNVKTS